MEQLLRDLAVTRAQQREHQRRAEELGEALRETEAWRAWRDAQKGGEAAMSEAQRLEAQVRTGALALFEATRNRTPVAGVRIETVRRMRYNAQEALAWCRQYAPALLALDRDLFVQVAPHLPGVPIQLEDTPEAHIADDLSAYFTQAPS
jgi:hypothetical protein